MASTVVTTGRNRLLFRYAKEYLLSLPDVTDRLLDRHIRFPSEPRPRSKHELFRSMLIRASNKQGMPNSIGPIDKLRAVCCGFDPDAFLSQLPHWEDLFHRVRSDVRPTSRMSIRSPHSYWVVFCKSAHSIARYLQRFPTYRAFGDYVKPFLKTEDLRIALALLIQEEVFGYRFALACDLLKETTSPLYIKPDTHIRFIFTGLGLTAEHSTDVQLFRDVTRFAESIGEAPYSVDKTFWLVGSGNFYNADLRRPTDRARFVKSALSRLPRRR